MFTFEPACAVSHLENGFAGWIYPPHSPLRSQAIELHLDRLREHVTLSFGERQITCSFCDAGNIARAYQAVSGKRLSLSERTSLTEIIEHQITCKAP